MFNATSSLLLNTSTMDGVFFFTATPKHSVTITKPGMNDAEVYEQSL